VPWRRGDVVEWRETWRGQVLLAFPVRVVEDRADLVAVYIPSGAPLAFPAPWPWGEHHPWRPRGRFQGHGVLVLHRPGDAYAVWVFWTGPERRFAEWYVNLQAPLRRDGPAIVTFDHELDLRIAADGTWALKDDDLLDERVAQGRFSAGEAAAIRAQAAAVIAEHDRGARWWDDAWAAWQPPAGWDIAGSERPDG
jgi:Protein of unknown function (DUF402)